jgi:hypothetical protein
MLTTVLLADGTNNHAAEIVRSVVVGSLPKHQLDQTIGKSSRGMQIVDSPRSVPLGWPAFAACVVDEGPSDQSTMHLPRRQGRFASILKTSAAAGHQTLARWAA